MSIFINRVTAPILLTVLKGGATCAQNGFRIFGLCVIFIACALITCVVYTQAHLVVPAIYAPFSFGWWVAMLGTLWFSTGVWLNYLGSLGKDPGVIPKGYRFVGYPELHYPPQGSGHFSTHTGPRVRGCNSCNAHKPPRAHHCSLCGDCVTKMDHHCPWINSCVGYHNQRHFVSFLLYLLVGTAFCGGHSAYIMLNPNKTFPRELAGHSLILFSAIINVALHIAMWAFVGWNMHLVLSNQTAIEFQINMGESAKAKLRGEVYRNPYDLGKWGNFVDLFVTRGDDFKAIAMGSAALPPTRNAGAVHHKPSSIAARMSLCLRDKASVAMWWARRVGYVLYLTRPSLQPPQGTGYTFRSWRAAEGPAAV